jgi:sarcosine oxidase
VKPTKPNYDFVVVGSGVFGSWTAHYLRLSGARVALLDAYGPANSRASSGGETRVIRMGYGPDGFYTRWSARSLPEWLQLGERNHLQVFHKTGVLWLSRDGDAYTTQLLDVLQANRMVCERLQADEIRRRWPQLSFPDVTWGVLEPESGVLMARQSIQTLVRENVRRGLDFIQKSVLAPESSGGKLDVVRTSDGSSMAAGAFIFASGPWLPKLFPAILGERIQPTRQEVFFLGPPAGDTGFSPPRMPVWLHHSHPDLPYALPDTETRGFKIAFDRHGEEFDPDTGSRVIGEKSMGHLRAYLKQHVPALQDAPIVETRVCQYENSSNGDFLIDRHPDLENVWLVGGGSGHGFKHGPAVGEHVSARVLQNAPGEPRFSLATKLTVRRREIF